MEEVCKKEEVSRKKVVGQMFYLSEAWPLYKELPQEVQKRKKWCTTYFYMPLKVLMMILSLFSPLKMNKLPKLFSCSITQTQIKKKKVFPLIYAVKPG